MQHIQPQPFYKISNFINILKLKVQIYLHFIHVKIK